MTTTYLTVDEVRKRLKVSRPMVDALIREGRLPACDLNAGRDKKVRILRVREVDLENFIERGSDAAVAKRKSRRRRPQQELPEKQFV